MTGAARLAVIATLGGCTLITDSFLTNEFSGDKFPVGVDTTSGALLVGARPAGDATDRRAVLDLLSPFTLIDPGTSDEPTLSYADLTLLGRAADGTLSIPRARFPEAQLLTLHPCAIPDGAGPGDLPPCIVGTTAEPRTFTAVIGADALAGDAIRLRLDSDPQIFVLADLGGGDRSRSLDCDAVFGSPYRGGGTLVLSGTELPFGNRRITLQTCLGPEPDPDPHYNAMAPFDPKTFRPSGANALFVVSTGIGTSILGEAAYARYRMARPDAPELAALPMGAVYLPSGQVTGRAASVDRLALVAASTSNALSPCRQLYAHRLLTTYQLTAEACHVDNAGNSLRDCPCKNGDVFCDVPAILELTRPAAMPLSVLVVPDTNPMLQALRTELRPDQPEVDGILGTDVLHGAEIDVDYPHDRLVARCRGDSCRARPALAQSGDVCQINRCLTGAASPRGCPGNDCATNPDSCLLPILPVSPPR